MKKIVIIGAGISGLSAGIYARQLGFETVIVEKHTISGGLCTGWDRKGHHIDGCIHWLTGTNKETELYKVWKNVGALDDDVPIHIPEAMGTFVYREGTITLWKDLSKLESDLLTLSPEDKPMIQDFIASISAMKEMNMPVAVPIDMMNVFEKTGFILSMKSSLKTIQTANKITIDEYGKNFKHPAIRKMFSNCMPPGYSLTAFLFSVATFSLENGGVPENGSFALAKRMETRYLDLGGQLIKGKAVKDICIENGLFKSIVLHDEYKIDGDYLISSCNPKILFKDLLQGKYSDPSFDMRFDNYQDYPTTTSVICSYSVATDLSHLPSSMTFETAEYTCGNVNTSDLNLKIYNYEKNFAPQGHTVVESAIPLMSSNYDYWAELKMNRQEYNQVKRELGNTLQKAIINHLPELKDKIRLLDVATPVTFERYTGADQGAWMGFVTTPNSKPFNHKGNLPQVRNVMISGQWTQSSGGLPVALLSGKFSVQRICKLEKINYRVDSLMK